MEIVESKGTGELLNWDDVNKMRYTWNVVCEAMRLAPPAQIGFKEALTEFTFAGFTIPKGWKVIVVLLSSAYPAFAYIYFLRKYTHFR